MEAKVALLQKELKTDASIRALKSLTDLKDTILTALSNELYYAHSENEAIRMFIDNNVTDRDTISSSTYTSINYTMGNVNENHSKGESELEVGSALVNRIHLLKHGSNEFFEVESNWKNVLNECIKYIKGSIIADRITSVTNSDIESIYNHLMKLYNLYFKTVEERENNHKLWLRLRMHTRSRIKLLDELSAEFKDGLFAKYPITTLTPGLYKTNDSVHLDGPSILRKTSDFIHSVKGKKYASLVESTSIVDSNTSSIINHNLNTDVVLHDSLYRSTLHASHSSISEDSNLLKLFELTGSIEQFKIAAKHIYKKYGDNLMSYAVFNNVVIFLIQSLHLPTVYNVTVEHVLNVYGIQPGSTIDLRTFTLMYWEVVNSVKFHVEQLYSVNYTVQRNSLLCSKLFSSKAAPYINISEHYNFIKKMTSGKSCAKYLSKETNTGELRVVELICKTPSAPNFDEVFSEINHLKQLNNQNLARYIAAHHDHNTIYIVSEFCAGSSLLNRMQLISKGFFQYTLSFVHVVFVQLIEALLYLHCNNITHGSLGIDKIMLVESENIPQIKLRDYGYFDCLNKGTNKTLLETIHAAPEAVDGRLTQKSNIWSAGIILLFLLTGKFPNGNAESPSFINQVLTMLANSQIFSCGDHAKDLVCRMLSYDVELRPSTWEIANHPWYSLTNLSNEPGNISFIRGTLNDLLVRNNLRRSIVEIFEKQTSLYVNKLEKVINALELASTATDSDLVDPVDFERILMLERLPESDIFDILKFTMTKTGKCSIKSFSLACQLWKICEINVLWSGFVKRCKNKEYYMNVAEFEELLNHSKTLLMPREEVKCFCNVIATDNKVYWDNFVQNFY